MNISQAIIGGGTTRNQNSNSKNAQAMLSRRFMKAGYNRNGNETQVAQQQH